MDMNEYQGENSFGQGWFVLYLYLYSFVVVHQTISIQLAHVTLDHFNPFTLIQIFAILSIVTTYFASLGVEVSSKIACAVITSIIIVC